MRRTLTIGSHRVGSYVKSIQRGAINLNSVTSATATITAVSVADAMILWGGQYEQSAASSPEDYASRVELTNATTVTAYRNTGAGGTNNIYFEVIEFYPGVVRSIQLGTGSTSATTTGTATITAVDTTKTWLSYLGFTSPYNVPSGPGLTNGSVNLTNLTTVTFNGQGAIDRTWGFCAVEFN